MRVFAGMKWVAMAALVLSCGIAPVRAELPASLTCTFADGGAWAFEKQGFVSKPVEALTIGISAIDRASMTARLDRKEGLAVLRMVQAVDAHHFIEVGMEGFMNLTTIYERDGTGGFPAVHSRHVAVLGEPLVSQYRGICLAK